MNYIIVDSNGLCWIAKYAQKGLSYGDMETGIMFGFLSQIKKIAKDFNTNKFIFSWDSKKSIRRSLYPQYKQHRREKQAERTPQEVIEDNMAFYQFYLLRTKVLPQLGFRNIFIRTGFESDDIIASLVIDPPEPLQSSKNIVVTTDDDLLQLLNRCDIYNPRTHETTTKDKFKEKYGLNPLDWPLVKQLAGCDSDNVEGVPGVGEIKAMQYVKKQMKPGKILGRIVKEGEAIIKRNAPLVCLPLIGTKPPEGFNIVEDTFNVDNFLDVFEKYGFQSFIKDLDVWRRTFNM